MLQNTNMCCGFVHAFVRKTDLGAQPTWGQTTVCQVGGLGCAVKSIVGQESSNHSELINFGRHAPHVPALFHGMPTSASIGSEPGSTVMPQCPPPGPPGASTSQQVEGHHLDGNFAGDAANWVFNRVTGACHFPHRLQKRLISRRYFSSTLHVLREVINVVQRPTPVQSNLVIQNIGGMTYRLQHAARCKHQCY